MPNLLITGSNGQVGREFKRLSSEFKKGFSYHFTDREELDITDEQAIQDFMAHHAIDIVINCAAYTAVDKAEEEETLATKINAEAAGFLAKACHENNAFLIQLSTDYVYDNQANRPMIETDACQPKSVYAKTKLEGERLVQSFTDRHIIIRTSWVYSTFGNNFVKTMVRLGQERDALRIIFDQIGTPTYARDLARAILQIIRQDNYLSNPGIYNYSNEGVTSWYDFALAIFAWQDIDCIVTPILSSSYPTAASRPHYSVLDKSKFTTTFGLSIPHWQDSLWACLDEGV